MLLVLYIFCFVSSNPDSSFIVIEKFIAMMAKMFSVIERFENFIINMFFAALFMNNYFMIQVNCVFWIDFNFFHVHSELKSSRYIRFLIFFHFYYTNFAQSFTSSLVRSILFFFHFYYTNFAQGKRINFFHFQTQKFLHVAANQIFKN